MLRGDTAQSVTIKTGLSDGTVTEVASGELKDGDLVVTDATTTGAPAGGGGGANSPVRGRMF